MKKYYIATMPLDTDRNGLVLCEYYQRAVDEEFVSLPEDGYTDLDEALAVMDQIEIDSAAFDWYYYLVETEDPNFVSKERNDDEELPVSLNCKTIAKVYVSEPGHGRREF